MSEINKNVRLIDACLAEELMWNRSEELAATGEAFLSGALAGAIGFLDKCPTIKINGDTSDGYHTFNELYHHRAILFSVICNANPDKAWKSKRHEDLSYPMYDGMFICGINTPEGQATYHYDINPYWDMFNVPELDFSPHWDGHTPEQAIQRIFSLSKKKENSPLSFYDLLKMDERPVFVVIKDINGFEDLTMWALVEVNSEDESVTLTNNLGGRSTYYSDSDFTGIYFYKNKILKGVSING